MTVSILLRLMPDELVHGRLIGRLRVVTTGEERPFRSVDELVAIAAEIHHSSSARDDLPARDVPLDGDDPPSLDAR